MQRRACNDNAWADGGSGALKLVRGYEVVDFAA